MSGPAPRGAAEERAQAHRHAAADADYTERMRRYWRGNLRLTAALMVVWFLVTFVLAYHARALSFSFFGWPFSFWVAAQGALVVYVAIVAFYAHRMNALDRDCGMDEAGG